MYHSAFAVSVMRGVSAGYDYGGESEIDGNKLDDRRQNYGWGLRLDVPVNRQIGLNVAYVHTRTLEDLGADSESLLFGVSYMF